MIILSKRRVTATMMILSKHRVTVVVSCVVVLCFVVYCIIEYALNSSQRWFADELPDPTELVNWTKTEMDEKLYKLSKWNGFNSSQQYNLFVEHQINGLHLNNSNESFYFLEAGVGVGAFARHILELFPHATGHGIDLEEKVIAIAAQVLPKNRVTLSVGNMMYINFRSGIFDYVFVPGAICYLHSLIHVMFAISEFARVLKVGGGVCLSMIASDTSPTGTCVTRIPKSTFTSNRYNLQVVSMEEMDDWHLSHDMGRYATCLRKMA